MTPRLLAAVLAAGTLISACGDSSANHGNAHVGTASGQALFSQACGACHTLSGHNDARHQGGDLRAFHASRAQLRQFAAEMPVRRPLTRAQLDAVVRFLAAVEGAGS